MLRATQFRTWSVIAALVTAVLYGSFCSTACAVAALPSAPALSHCEKCEHARPADSSHGQPAPSDRNCGRHVHPTDFVKAADAPDLHSSAILSVNPFAAIAINPPPAAFFAASSFYGLAPPGPPEAPLPEDFSILRI